MNYLNKNGFWLVLLVTHISVSMSQTLEPSTDEGLTLSEAIDSARINDPWITGSEFKQAELTAMAVAGGQLPDPQMSVSIANIAADTFAFNQEPMSQFKVGLSQMFPRGATRSLKTEQLNLLAYQQPLLRANRLALITMQTSHLWLDTFRAQESIRLIESDRALFEQLVELVEASYSSGFGQTRQHDVIRAQLELTRLEDRLTQLKQLSEGSAEQLRGYISQNYLSTPEPTNKKLQKFNLKVQASLPEIKLQVDGLLNQEHQGTAEKLMQTLALHPAVKALDRQLDAENKGVELAQQKYKPAWSINASYGYRDNAENNINRADLFSVGITFDLPLFTKNRQDQAVKAAVSSVASLASQRLLLLRQLMSSFDEEAAKLNRLQQRKQLFESSILPQMDQQAEAALSAYTHDDGDFAEVIRAKIAELNAQIDALEININIAKTKVKLNYLFAGKQTEDKMTNKAMETEHE